ncbi:transglutaminase domain-containing protein [Paenibacillus xerothermodurans]|uniref:Transglutaminase domain-containing protein n=1 Tax=Paenibacillus xerothermodurans TaxID=1977292 RepID=A0A2W1P0L1_PAEXE|nr:transglutaminase domain-containing protein [Paenibacillus xerothermodurans]PZE21282.1 transglutaminase domain-containing protein [Paenibacillus xerothermodurans]
MPEITNALNTVNWITVLIIGTLLISVIQGFLRGGSSSARHLVLMVAEGLTALVGVIIAWQLAAWLSPVVQVWLTSLQINIPARQLGFFEQIYYTAVTGVRDFSLLRYGLLFVIGYSASKQLLYRAIDPLVDLCMARRVRQQPDSHSARLSSGLSSLLGGLIGTVTGTVRALLVIAALFIFSSLFPHMAATNYIEASGLYQKGADEVIKPVTGDFITAQLPVFTKAAEQEFMNILQRKYEVVDAHVPKDIAAAAQEVTAEGDTDEEKAKLLYSWVGSRVKYDWEKVRLYEEQRIWKEQTPEETFATRQGVCIDYSRLYAVMARSIGLDVKVVTGLGYDGKGSYGPHAWNEVYLADQHKWVPLDSTWVASGGNWFNPPNFNETHIREA